MVQFSKKVFTYASLLVVTILALPSVDVVQCTKYYARHPTLQQYREKPRATRGFKGLALQTARGFGKRNLDLLPLYTARGWGKRDSVFKITESEPFQQKVSQRESFPIDWLLEEMQNDPELIRIFLKKFVDSNQDDEITPDELIRQDNPRLVNNLAEEQ